MREDRPSIGTSRPRRAGMAVVYCSLVLVLLLGMCGLTVDLGLLMASHGQLQGVADAAAKAAAKEMLLRKTNQDATAAAVAIVNQHNSLSGAQVAVNIPPTQGQYAGNSRYVQVTVTSDTPTYFIQAVPGVAPQQTIGATAVAGLEDVPVQAIIFALDRDARPGLDVRGTGSIRALGNVFVNSEGGGLDETGSPSLTQQEGMSPYAAVGGADGSTNSFFVLGNVFVVGGVKDPSRFKDVLLPTGPTPLRCNRIPVPDPLVDLPVPSAANGVLGPPEGIEDLEITINSATDYEIPSELQEVWENEWVDANGTIFLPPGVYKKIHITGGKVVFRPGIFVFKATEASEPALKVTGGTVEGLGVMLYFTDDTNYDPTTGGADAGDPYDPFGLSSPGPPSSSTPTIEIDAPARFTAINTGSFPYSVSPGVFNGMVVYQRRTLTRPLHLRVQTGGNLEGLVYAKWAEIEIKGGGGIYDGRYVARQVSFSSGESITQIRHSGKGPAVRVPRVFLVE